MRQLRLLSLALFAAASPAWADDSTTTPFSLFVSPEASVPLDASAPAVAADDDDDGSSVKSEKDDLKKSASTTTAAPLDDEDRRKRIIMTL